MQEKKVAVATSAPPSEEELNPYTIFPQPEENFKVCSTLLGHISHNYTPKHLGHFVNLFFPITMSLLQRFFSYDLGSYRNIFQQWKYMEST